jgi:hypothetical protein
MPWHVVTHSQLGYTNRIAQLCHTTSAASWTACSCATHLEALHLADVADWRDGPLALLVPVDVEQVALRVKLQEQVRRQSETSTNSSGGSSSRRSR